MQEQVTQMQEAASEDHKNAKKPFVFPVCFCENDETVKYHFTADKLLSTSGEWGLLFKSAEMFEEHYLQWAGMCASHVVGAIGTEEMGRTQEQLILKTASETFPLTRSKRVFEPLFFNCTITVARAFQIARTLTTRGMEGYLRCDVQLRTPEARHDLVKILRAFKNPYPFICKEIRRLPKQPLDVYTEFEQANGDYCQMPEHLQGWGALMMREWKQRYPEYIKCLCKTVERLRLWELYYRHYWYDDEDPKTCSVVVQIFPELDSYLANTQQLVQEIVSINDNFDAATLLANLRTEANPAPYIPDELSEELSKIVAKQRPFNPFWVKGVPQNVQAEYCAVGGDIWRMTAKTRVLGVKMEQRLQQMLPKYDARHTSAMRAFGLWELRRQKAEREARREWEPQATVAFLTEQQEMEKMFGSSPMVKVMEMLQDVVAAIPAVSLTAKFTMHSHSSSTASASVEVARRLQRLTDYMATWDPAQPRLPLPTLERFVRTTLQEFCDAKTWKWLQETPIPKTVAEFLTTPLYEKLHSMALRPLGSLVQELYLARDKKVLRNLHARGVLIETLVAMGFRFLGGAKRYRDEKRQKIIWPTQPQPQVSASTDVQASTTTNVQASASTTTNVQASASTSTNVQASACAHTSVPSTYTAMRRPFRADREAEDALQEEDEVDDLTASSSIIAQMIAKHKAKNIPSEHQMLKVLQTIHDKWEEGTWAAAAPTKTGKINAAESVEDV